MTLTFTVSELFQACNVLFQPEFNYSVDFINSLDSSSLKLAFRKKALATHPDRSESIGCSKDILNRKFVEVTNAYHVLAPVVEKGVNLDVPKPFRANSKTTNKEHKPSYTQTNKKSKFTNDFSEKYTYKGQRERYYSGPMPGSKLLLGQYLYYSGIITWKQLIDSIVWQKNQGLLFGQIAKNWEMVTDKQLRAIIRGLSYKEKIGEYATRKGYITKFQKLAILGKQSLQRKPIGYFFIEKTMLSERQVEQAVDRLYYHNLKYK